MTIDDKIRDEKLQYDINREVAKISALSSWSIDKYEYLTGEEILPFNKRQIIEQSKFAYSPLGKAFKKQTEKQVGATESLDLSIKKDKVKQIEGIFSQNLMNDLIRAKSIERFKLSDIIKKDDLNYKWKSGKTDNFGKYPLLIAFLRNIYEGHLSIEKDDNKQSNFAIELKNFQKGTKALEKSLF